MPLLKFSADIQFKKQHHYYLCVHARTQVKVLITARVKEVIEQHLWIDSSPEEQEEIRSLRELGFLIDAEISEPP